MKSELYIFCNNKIKNFLSILLSEYELSIMKLDEIKNNIKTSQANIIIISNKNDIDLIDNKSVNDNFLIISYLKNINLNFTNNSNILSCPISINIIKNRIENFVQNIKVQFHDISIYNEKLINLNNDSFCRLTKIELEILTFLIREKKNKQKFH